MIKQPFQHRDFVDPSVLEHITKVAGMLRRLSTATGLGADVLILESPGSTLDQQAWQDVTGWYVTFRPHPLYSRLPVMKEAVEKAKAEYFELFPGNRGKTVTVEDPASDNSNVTLHVVTGAHSIGD